MPTKAEVSTRVILILSDFTNLSAGKISPGHILKDTPLKMDSTGLANLALALRGYIKAFKKEATITVTEVRKSGLSVQDLISLVHQKIQSS